MTAIPEALAVLVIDDHRFQRIVLVRLLKSLGVSRILEAEDGAAALTIVRANRDSLALIISDVDMPEMDGLEFLRRLAKEAPLTPVALHSALDRALLKSVQAMSAEYGLQLVGMLDKPATEEALLDLLTKVVQRRSTSEQVESPANASEVAFALGRHEFEPWFQPKIDLRTGRACGAEVLARWCRLHAQPLPPDRFLSVVVANGLMRALTLGLATKSAQHLRRLGASGQNFTLSLNVCPTLLDDPEFADALARSLLDAGATAGEVVLEITETAASRNQGAALENLARLRMRGFDLSIDDFGTGYSSLAQLVRAPFSELKIDSSFVSRIASDQAARTLVETVIAMARRLGLRTVAEGIETEEQHEILVALDCDMGQGYLFARPMPVTDWLIWMRRAEQVAATSSSESGSR